MNRRAFERHLREHGCFLHHRGGNHDVWINPGERHAGLSAPARDLEEGNREEHLSASRRSTPILTATSSQPPSLGHGSKDDDYGAERCRLRRRDTEEQSGQRRISDGPESQPDSFRNEPDQTFTRRGTQAIKRRSYSM